MTESKSKSQSGTAFVVGGSGGIGRAICKLLAAEWDNVFFTYRSNQTAASALSEELAPLCNSAYAPLDIRDQQSIRTALQQAEEKLGPIGTVVFACGASIAQPFVSDISDEQWDDVFQTELIGYTKLARAAIPILRRNGGGNFVNVISFAMYSYPPGDALSAVPKAGIEMLGKAIAREEGRYNIRSNSVAPGIINAGLGEQFMQTMYTPEIWETQRKRVPLRRFGTGEEVAEAVVFLASNRARYINGQTIIVDGGMHI
ncbi:MAG: short-chain dehydrogenase [Verrucomicrobiaceae bacterium]|nr:short-chain dehydrogenase [Verrucomicrobiaceae bacterium]